MKSAATMRRPHAVAAPIVGWASLSTAALLVVFRPDAAAFYLPLVLLALIASIVCFAGRRLGHGLKLVACVLLMPAVIAESIVYSTRQTGRAADIGRASGSARSRGPGWRRCQRDVRDRQFC